jgi:hypothetical protein
MVETRIAPRYRIAKAAAIEFIGGPVSCVVRDISTTGAALEVPSQIGIPAQFTLVLPDEGLHLPCQVVWRREFRIGVAFD